MGWRLHWASTAHTDFNFDLGFSHTEEQGREAVAQMTGSGLPPIVEQNANATGTDIAGYLTESPGFSTFVRDDGAVHHTYSMKWRGLGSSSWATTRSSTARRRAATRARRGRSGSASTTSTRASDECGERDGC
jgi:predicted dithiol-disulfide oxidoreductase (DUF899 family)